MGQIQKQRIYEGGNGVVDKWTIDFNGGVPSDLQNVLVSSQALSSGSRLAVIVETSNCTGIAGNMEVKQSVQDSGKPNYAYAAPATITPPASGSGSVGFSGTSLEFMGTHVVIDASGITWPTAGRMIITMITKF